MNKTHRWRGITPIFAVLLFLFFIAVPGGQARAAEPIKVGVLHSLSGTMSISEVAVKDGTLMAIAEINAKGGLLGRQIVPIIEDGASDWPTFAEKAKKLISKDKVVVVFGCWTSASRKAVLPVFEKADHLLILPCPVRRAGGLEEYRLYGRRT